MKQLFTYAGRLAYWCGWPVLWLLLYNTQRTRVLLCDGDKVLVTKNWLSNGKWSLPGGGLHKHEDPVLGAQRETYEEVGLRITNLQALSAQPLRAKDFRFSSYFYTAKADQAASLRLGWPEVIDAKWLDTATLSSQNANPETVTALQLFAAHAKNC